MLLPATLVARHTYIPASSTVTLGITSLLIVVVSSIDLIVITEGGECEILALVVRLSLVYMAKNPKN